MSFLKVLVSAMVFSSLQLTADVDWPRFRGPNGAGVADSEKAPVHFGPGTNQLWKVECPGGSSSPSLWKNRIFLTAYANEKLETLCYDRESGKLLWRKTAPAETIEAFHPDGSPAASTPATDGERVYVYFGSCGLLAYNMDGSEAWRVEMPVAKHMADFGTGTSPIIHSGRVILNRDTLNDSHLVVVDAKTGGMIYRKERPEFRSSWSTPIIWQQDGFTDIVVAGSHTMKGYDFSTGKERWFMRGLPNGACPSPVLGEGLLFYGAWSPSQSDFKLPTFSELQKNLDANGNGTISKPEADDFTKLTFTYWDLNEDGEITLEEWDKNLKSLAKGENLLQAVRPGEGDITSNVLWKQTRGLPYVPSIVYYRGLLFMVKDGGMVSCLDPKSGEAHYLQERLGSPGSYYSSPVAADGKIYIASTDGKITVLAASKTPEVLARADLMDGLSATPAIADNTIYYRTKNHLWAFKNH